MIQKDTKDYQIVLGFSNKTKLKIFFDAKDIIRDIDFNYLCELNKRLDAIIRSINNAVVEEIKPDDIDEFILLNVNEVFWYMKSNGLLEKFSNNKQRQTERSYYDWSRGRIVANYFKKALAIIFNVNIDEIKTIGLDNLENPSTFSKSATADFEITTNSIDKYRIEFQCGFQGINDIKEHKVLEAKRILKSEGIHSLIVHIDLYNGCAAFVDISSISDDSIQWETRTQFEGKKVFNIDQKYFLWCLNDLPPKLSYILGND